jgi:adenylate kinase
VAAPAAAGPAAAPNGASSNEVGPIDSGPIDIGKPPATVINPGLPAQPAGADGTARIILLGRQGSGKGTQAARLAVLFGVTHISTGDAFRAAVESGSELGRTTKSYMDSGELVPDEVVIDVIRERLRGLGALGPGGQAGFILDGFPRNVAQAEALKEMIGPRGLDVVVNLEVSLGEVLRRIAGRRICVGCGTSVNTDNAAKAGGDCDACGGKLVQRDDDTEGAVRRRLELYESVTAPLVDWYQGEGLLATVDAVGSPDDVTQRVVAAIEAVRQNKVVR